MSDTLASSATAVQSTSSSAVSSNARRNSFPVNKVASRAEMFLMKVMRLPSPFLKLNSPITWHPSGYGGTDSFALSSDLTISSSLGTIYLGETFRACISVTHKFSYILRSVSFKIEIQTSSRRYTLIDSSNSPLDFSPDETRDYILQHTISEPEDNNLVCSINYVDDDGQKHSFQKFFILKVETPLLIHTALHQKDDMMFAELHLTNLVPEPVCLEQAEFIPNPMFAVQDLNRIDPPLSAVSSSHSPSSIQQTDAASDDTKSSDQPPSLARQGSLSVFPDVTQVLLEPQASRFYIFRVKSKDPLDNSAFSVGYFQIRWRSQLGKSGVLTTKTITRSIQPEHRREFSLLLIEGPAEALLETPFAVVLEIRNNTSDTVPLHLTLQRERMGSILPFGRSALVVGDVPPRSHKRVSVELLATSLGLQPLSGFLLTSSHPHYKHLNHSFDNIHVVYARKTL